MNHYDLAVIGAGSGNSVIDERFADRSVAILQDGPFGGTCLNVGCIPTKMFVYPADLARSVTHARELGVDLRLEAVRWPQIRDRIFARIDPIAMAGRAWRENNPNVTVYEGRCRFVGERRLVTGTGEEVTADQIVIAAGSRVVVPDLPGLSQVPFHTSDTVMRLSDLPARMVIVGGGFVAAEFAHDFSSYGVQVSQVHRGPHLLRKEDQDVAARFTELAGRQWGVRLDATVERVAPDGNDTLVHLADGTALACDVLLVATGRVSNADLLEVVEAGVEVDEGGVIRVDAQQRTSAAGVWALGDVANHFQLKHVANHEARVVQHNLLHPDDPVQADHRFVPSAVFTSPQVASAGLTEQDARANGTPYVTATQDYADVAYGWAMEDRGHFVKLLADPTTHRLLGAHLIGPQASVLIQPLLQGMSAGATVSEMARNQYWIHPSLAEVCENALLKLEL